MRKWVWIAVAAGFLVSWHYTKKLDAKEPRLITGPDLKDALISAFVDVLATNKSVPIITAQWPSPEEEGILFKPRFQTKLKPAIEHWCKGFGEHAPFSPDQVTWKHFTGCTGTNLQYIFVVDNMTIGVSEYDGVFNLDYFHAGPQTDKVSEPPTNAPPRISTAPITSANLAKILNEIGTPMVRPHEIRITPTGPSNSINPGIHVNVGGHPDNIASWRYNILLRPNGKLIYYLKGSQN